jgi:hypothetical protein
MPFEIAYFEEFQSENEASLSRKIFQIISWKEYLKKEWCLVAQVPARLTPVGPG